MQRVVLHHTVGPIRIPLASSWAVLRAGFDVFHVQFAAPLLCPARIVVTIHDIMFEHHPDYYAPADLRQLRLRVPRTVQRAAAILTGSEYSRQDIVRRFHIPAEKVTVAQYAPDPMFRPLADRDALAAVRETYRTGERFILFAGALKPNKNLKTLVAAYVSLRQSGTVAYPLVLAGTRNLLDEDVFAPARAAGLGEALVFTGHVPDDDLVALYNAADVFVQPSISRASACRPLKRWRVGRRSLPPRPRRYPKLSAMPPFWSIRLMCRVWHRLWPPFLATRRCAEIYRRGVWSARQGFHGCLCENDCRRLSLSSQKPTVRAL